MELIMVQLTLDSRCTPDNRAAAEAALSAFQSANNLSDTQVLSIWRDKDHPLFDKLDSDITLAATAGWHQPNEFKGYDLY